MVYLGKLIVMSLDTKYFLFYRRRIIGKEQLFPRKRKAMLDKESQIIASVNNDNRRMIIEENAYIHHVSNLPAKKS
jgi:hypothetical protein